MCFHCFQLYVYIYKSLHITQLEGCKIDPTWAYNVKKNQQNRIHEHYTITKSTVKIPWTNS
jgi:lysozyme family protein